MIPRRSLSVFFWLLILSVMVVAQQEARTTNKILKELQLDTATPEDAVSLLGTPVKDEFDDLRVGKKRTLHEPNVEEMLQTNGGAKSFRTLTFKDLGEMDTLKLRFYEDKLIQAVFQYHIHRNKSEILASAMPQMLSVDFVILASVARDAKLSDFEGQRENTIPKVYDVLYTLLSVGKDRAYFVRVQNNDSKGFWRSVAKRPTKEMFPGSVIEMNVISRRLEKR